MLRLFKSGRTSSTDGASLDGTPSRKPFWLRLGLQRRLSTACSSMLDTALHIFITITDFSMVHFGPLYVALGLALILAVSYTYLALIYRQLYAERGPVHAALHLFFGLALLYNILLNYWLCVATPPGSTAAMKEGYHMAAGSSMRFCKHCRRAKPALSHHCHICQRCVLRMDHHCPWVNNCIGHFNYRHFVLFVLYLCLGAGYAACSAWGRMSMRETSAHDMGWLIIVFALSASTAFALVILFAWHAYLICTAQSTVDFLGNWAVARELRRQGKLWENPYDLGCTSNWQEAFDVHGRLWWLRWLLPTLQPKAGSGMAYATKSRSRLASQTSTGNQDSAAAAAAAAAARAEDMV